MPIFEPLTANITIAIDALEQLHIDWHAIFKSIWEAAIKYAQYLAQNLQPMALPVFIRNMHITRSKDETQEFTDNADLIRYGSKFIEQWYQIYRTETQKYNVPKRQLLPKCPQPMPKQEMEEQHIITNPYRTKKTSKAILQSEVRII
ncbi:MAG: hypothetical protein EZS28_033214 [Streblomastix strix]|uniref:Uncharacterized protein n=1 Tax=Streblomastix strix TaxID=222440 RepID=A0A5J4UML8_9EUKA|nr:MAG: hypothetical protein EZS28_033214 [Streblomastix strix]